MLSMIYQQPNPMAIKLPKDLEEQVSAIDGFLQAGQKEKVDLLAFILTRSNNNGITATDINVCFQELDLRPYGRISAYLSEEANKSAGKYVKKPGGYRLERETLNSIRSQVEENPIRIRISSKLKALLVRLTDSREKQFLKEALDCYQVKANRAAIVMAWVLATEHFQRYIFANKLQEFNTALSKNPDKKVSKIVDYDDFSDLPEVKLIEVARSASIVTNDQRKVLDEKLGIRNSAAHPSGISVSEHKAAEFILDVTENIVLKF